MQPWVLQFIPTHCNIRVLESICLAFEKKLRIKYEDIRITRYYFDYCGYNSLDEDSVIFKVVSFAWAGFGATFGPVMLFSLFWKRVTRAGAIAGMISGGGMVFLWNKVIRPIGGVFGIYELLPAFVLSCLVIVIVSLLTKEESREVREEFELAKTSTV